MIDNDKYYQLAGEASSVIGDNPGLIEIKKLTSDSEKILDVGCGEGTRLNTFLGNTKSGTGVDVSSYALKKAKKKYPKNKFFLYDGLKFPFDKNTFDLTYSTFVLEHTDNPKSFIDEMVRVTSVGGFAVVLCPNYGAPSRRSPVSTEKPVSKLIKGFLGDIFSQSKDLSFTKVTPKKVFEKIDDDTTCEPYLTTLVRYMKNNRDLKIIKSSSLWEIDDNAVSFHQRIFKFLGQLNIYPFKNWGPQLFIVIKKLK